MPQEISVRHVVGRYPQGNPALRSENIIASVSEIGRVYRVRIEDAEHPDAWIDVTIEVDNDDEIVMAEPLDEEDVASIDRSQIPF